MLSGMCSYTDITENRIDLADVALMNDLIDVQHYNSRLINEARQAPARDPGPGPAPDRPGGDFYVPAAFRR